MVFEFSWQIGAGENSQIPVKSSTIHSPSNDTIFVSGNDEPRFSNCVSHSDAISAHASVHVTSALGYANFWRLHSFCAFLSFSDNEEMTARGTHPNTYLFHFTLTSYWQNSYWLCHIHLNSYFLILRSPKGVRRIGQSGVRRDDVDDVAKSGGEGNLVSRFLM